MSARRRVKHSTSLEDRIAERTEEIKAMADALPPGSKERERLERRLRQADTFAHMTEWITSPGLDRQNRG
jgi:predicted RNase H-like nuclease (RuvC/YqgF family)